MISEFLIPNSQFPIQINASDNGPPPIRKTHHHPRLCNRCGRLPAHFQQSHKRPRPPGEGTNGHLGTRHRTARPDRRRLRRGVPPRYHLAKQFYSGADHRLELQYLRIPQFLPPRQERRRQKPLFRAFRPQQALSARPPQETGRRHSPLRNGRAQLPFHQARAFCGRDPVYLL